MKKILILMIGLLLIGVNVFAQGNLLVNGKIGIGATQVEMDAETHYQFNVKDDGRFVNLGTTLNVAGMVVSETTDLLSANAFLGYDYQDGNFQISGNNGVKFYTNWPSNITLALYVDVSGKIGIGTLNPQGKLDVNGAIYQRGSSLHADYVFEPDYELETIEEHSKYMWNNHHLKAIPKAKVDKDGQEVIEVGSHRRGIVEELEKAHIYIDQLQKYIKAFEERLVKLEAKGQGIK